MTPKPCPFCGARGRALIVSDLGDDYEWPTWLVECDTCGAKGPDLQPGADVDGNYTRAEAIRAWNTRNGK